VVDDRLHPLDRRLWDTLDFVPPSSADGMFRILQRGNVVTGATLAFRRALVALAVPIPESPLFLHDWWLGLLAAATGILLPMPETLILYRQHGRQQLGAVLDGGRPRRKPPSVDRAAGYASQIGALRCALERLEHSSGLTARPAALEALAAQLRHRELRAHMPGGLLRRLPSVAAELLNGNYHRYSRGLVSAARDLWA
jgi:hypothetical protein